MKRRAPAGFDAFCREALDFLASARVPYLVIGGLAVSAVGEPRMTGDVDVVAYLELASAEALIAVASRHGFGAAADERARLAATGTLRFHKAGFQLDIILASLPFEEAARDRATTRKLFGRMVPLPTPEDLILFKVLAGRDKDMVDAVGVARRHLARLDRAYLESSVRAVCELAEDTQPQRRLDEVLEKAGR